MRNKKLEKNLHSIGEKQTTNECLSEYKVSGKHIGQLFIDVASLSRKMEYLKEKQQPIGNQ